MLQLLAENLPSEASALIRMHLPSTLLQGRLEHVSMRAQSLSLIAPSKAGMPADQGASMARPVEALQCQRAAATIVLERFSCSTASLCLQVTGTARSGCLKHGYIDVHHAFTSHTSSSRSAQLARVQVKVTARQGRLEHLTVKLHITLPLSP